MKYSTKDISMNPIYDPFEFIKKIELLTIALLGSFITMKFLNALYDNLYEPTMDVILDSNKSDKYFIKIGKHYVQIGAVVKEFIKWIILIIFLMIIYNLFVYQFS